MFGTIITTGMIIRLDEEQQEQGLLAAELVAGEDVAGGGDGQQRTKKVPKVKIRVLAYRLTSRRYPASRKLSSVSGRRRERGHILAEGGGAEAVASIQINGLTHSRARQHISTLSERCERRRAWPAGERPANEQPAARLQRSWWALSPAV